MKSFIVIIVGREFVVEIHEIGFQLSGRLVIKLYDKYLLGKVSLKVVDKNLIKLKFIFFQLWFKRKINQLFELERSELCIG